MAVIFDNYFVKGLLIAVIFGVPAGAIGTLTIQRTLEKGFVYGLATGTGSTAADLLYAAVSLFGVSFISDFLTKYTLPIRLVGSVIILIFGITILRKKPKETSDPAEKRKSVLSCFFTSFVVAITNPASLLAYAVAFSTVDISGKVTGGRAILLLGGVLVGATLWWLGISGIVTIFRKRITGKIYNVLNYCLGILLIVFSLIIVVSVFIRK